MLQLPVRDVCTVLVALAAGFDNAICTFALASVDSRDGGACAKDLIGLERLVLLYIVLLDRLRAGGIESKEFSGGTFCKNTTVTTSASSLSERFPDRAELTRSV